MVRLSSYNQDYLKELHRETGMRYYLRVEGILYALL